MEMVKKIKSEIEKRLALQSLIKGEFAEGSRDALNGLLSFIETLESEKPIDDGLEEEIERHLHSLGVGYGGWIDGIEDDDLRGIARHFYKLGQERP